MVDGPLLHRIVTEWEELEEDRKVILREQKAVIEAGVDAGLEKVLLKKFINERRKGLNEVQDERDHLDEYHRAWLEFESTPLGAYAKGRLMDDDTDEPKKLPPMFDA